jgi:hypothetical protein
MQQNIASLMHAVYIVVYIIWITYVYVYIINSTLFNKFLLLLIVQANADNMPGHLYCPKYRHTHKHTYTLCRLIQR